VSYISQLVSLVSYMTTGVTSDIYMTTGVTSDIYYMTTGYSTLASDKLFTSVLLQHT